MAAQSNPGRSGLSIEVATGASQTHFRCDGCSARTYSSPLLSARIGYATDPQVVFGVQADSWHKNLNDFVAYSLRWYGVFVEGYPLAKGHFRGLYGRLNFGAATIHPEVEGAPRSRDIGGGGGIGYDIRVIRGVSMVPHFDVLVARRADLSPEGRGPVPSWQLRSDGPHSFRNTRNGPYIGAFVKSFGISLKLN
jgi:hypothetical protein